MLAPVADSLLALWVRKLLRHRLKHLSYLRSVRNIDKINIIKRFFIRNVFNWFSNNLAVSCVFFSDISHFNGESQHNAYELEGQII